jgi:hypothetical protein
MLQDLIADGGPKFIHSLPSAPICTHLGAHVLRKPVRLLSLGSQNLFPWLPGSSEIAALPSPI